MKPWIYEGYTSANFAGCLDKPHFNEASLPVNDVMSTVTSALVRSVNTLSYCPETLTNPGVCSSLPCLNGADCSERGGDYKCHCRPRFKGRQCEIDTEPCASSPCLNNGVCIQDGYSYKCQCPAHVSGTRCQYLYCSPNPCLNDGTCEESLLGPICRCVGFKGIYCNEDINECDSTPCLHGGTCINTYGGFNCLCAADFTGHDCSQTRMLPLVPQIEEVSENRR